MLLLSFLLGLAFGYLTDVAHQRVTVWLASRVSTGVQTAAQWVGFAVGFLIFLIAAAIFFRAMIQHYQHDWNGGAWRVVLFLTEWRVLGAAFAFAAGMALFWWRQEVSRLVNQLGNLAAPASIGLKLALAGGIAVIAVAVALINPRFFDQVALNFWGVEARFGATASQGERASTVAASMPAQWFETRFTINGWAQVDRFLDQWALPLSRTLYPSDGEPVRRAQAAREFLAEFALPLADVMSCLAAEFPVHRTKFQNDLLVLANAWAHIALDASETASGKRAAAPASDHAREYGEVASRHRKLVFEIDADLTARGSRCGGAGKEGWTRYPRASNRRAVWNDVSVKPVVPNSPAASAVEPERLTQIFTNGMVIAFLGDFVLFAHGEQAGVELAMRFLRTMSGRVYRKDAPSALNVAYKMADLIYRDEFRDSSAAIAELEHVRQRASEIAEALQPMIKDRTKGDDRAQRTAFLRYYRALDAFALSLQMYNRIRDRLEGRKLSAVEMDEMKDWAGVLGKWLTEHYRSDNVHDSQDGSRRATGRWAANIGNTLAMYELATGLNEGAVDKDRCLRGWLRLSGSYRQWQRLKDREFLGEDDFRGVERVYRTHRNLFAEACGFTVG